MARALTLPVTAAVLLCSAATCLGQYQVVATTSESAEGLVRTEMTVQVGANPLDRFKMVRLVRDVPGLTPRPAILLLPSIWTDFSSYEARSADGGPDTSIAGFFAFSKFDVYGYSSRLEGVTAGTCEAGTLDCSSMTHWDLQAIVEDLGFVRQWIEAINPGVPVFAGGHSLGAMSAIASVNASPSDYAGVFLWEGTLYSADPAVQALNQGYCASLQAQLAAGGIFDGVQPGLISSIVELAALRPLGLTPLRLYPLHLTNHQVLVLTSAVPSPGPLTMPVPDLVWLAGSFADDTLSFASEEIVRDHVSRFHDYLPIALMRDISCALAGLDTTHVGGLGSFTGSVLAIGAEHGYGPYLDDVLGLFAAAETEIVQQPGFGHSDHLLTEDYIDQVALPTRGWIRKVVTGPASPGR